jgi:hypothetical protein
MAIFRQHLPGYVDPDLKAPDAEFSNTAELLALEVVQGYGKTADFSHFAMGGNYLMEIRDDGFMWWAVGSVSDPSIVDLPKWDGGKYRAMLEDGTCVTLGPGEVVSSGGGVLTLRDGTKAQEMRRKASSTGVNPMLLSGRMV